MDSNEQQERATNVPRLRVVGSETRDDGHERRPPDPTDQPRHEWLRTEAYWAGRNRAGRLSARLAA
jgi:hypothetical protein